MAGCEFGTGINHDTACGETEKLPDSKTDNL
jgi:hypothetical protein